MPDNDKQKVLSIRGVAETFGHIDDFRRSQLAIPSRSEALKTLVRLGFEKWKEMETARKP